MQEMAMVREERTLMGAQSLMEAGWVLLSAAAATSPADSPTYILGLPWQQKADDLERIIQVLLKAKLTDKLKTHKSPKVPDDDLHAALELLHEYFPPEERQEITANLGALKGEVGTERATHTPSAG